MLGSFGKQTSKKALNEMHTMEKQDGPREFHKLPADIEEELENERNAFTAGLAKTKKGGEFEVGGKKFKDRTNYDAPMKEDEDGKEHYETTQDFLDHVFDILNDEMRVGYFSVKGLDKADAYLTKHGEKLAKSGKSAHDVAEALMSKFVGLDEYQFDQMYPDDPGPFEGKDVDDMIKEFLVREDDVNWDRMDDEEAEENETDNGIEEDINLPSSQATGPSIEEARRPLSHLSPEERDQLKQYVETIKTVKEEINKMMNKSGMKEGGNMTNLIMRPNTGGIRK
jgi:hypothetical protein